MTTKTEMTLENVCFRYDGSDEAKECFRAFREKTKCLWSPQEGMIYGIVDNKPKIDFAPVIGFTEISASDYLLLLSAPESQAHLLTERSEPCGNCKETIKECACMRNICFKCNKPVGNITFSVCDECWNILHPPKNNSAKELLASQPPVMEGKEEMFVRLGNYDYILSDNKILENDWFIANQAPFKCIEVVEGNYPYKVYNQFRNNEVNFHSKHWLKIVATNNPELITDGIRKLASQPPVMEGKKETLQDVIKRVSPFGTMTISNPKMLIALEDFIGQKTSSLQSEVEQLKGLLKEAQPFCGTMLRGKIEHYTSK